MKVLSILSDIKYIKPTKQKYLKASLHIFIIHPFIFSLLKSFRIPPPKKKTINDHILLGNSHNQKPTQNAEAIKV
jgi:hypothetical protein